MIFDWVSKVEFFTWTFVTIEVIIYFLHLLLFDIGKVSFHAYYILHTR